MSKKFEHGALAAVVGLVLGLVMLVGLSPLDRETSAPEASLRLAVPVPVAATSIPVTPVAAATVASDGFATSRQLAV